MHFAMSPDSLLFFYAVVASVTAAFGLFSLYKHLTHRGRHAGMAWSAGDLEEHRPLTVAPSLLVPQFMYNRLVRHSGKGASSTECAVCLGVIQVGAMAKLLPAFAHVYHVDCIDVWLASHSTCPLCRCRVGDHSRAAQKTVQDLAYLSPV
ncbi:hypothetical protein ACQ4PT_016916 [Festuca glaucescens]